MRKKDIIKAQEYEANLYKTLILYEKIYGKLHENTEIRRAEWAGVYNILEMLGVPVNYELREEME